MGTAVRLSTTGPKILVGLKNLYTDVHSPNSVGQAVEPKNDSDKNIWQ